MAYCQLLGMLAASCCLQRAHACVLARLWVHIRAHIRAHAGAHTPWCRYLASAPQRGLTSIARASVKQQALVRSGLWLVESSAAGSSVTNEPQRVRCDTGWRWRGFRAARAHQHSAQAPPQQHQSARHPQEFVPITPASPSVASMHELYTNTALLLQQPSDHLPGGWWSAALSIRALDAVLQVCVQ